MVETDGLTPGHRTTVWEVVAEFEHRMLNMLDEARKTPDEQLESVVQRHYLATLQGIVWEMTCLPSNREDAGLDPSTDNEEFREGFTELMNLITSAFGYSKQKVETDMKPFLRKYTPEDIREIRRLKRENLLN